MLQNFLNSMQEKYQFNDCEIYLKNNFELIIEKFNWDYAEALKFQNDCTEFILIHDHYRVYIFCSHPNVFTMGRGLQKLKGTPSLELIEFDSNLEVLLNSPIINIKRGGGLTFHHPGQLVFYPILKVTKYNIKVHDLMLNILETAKFSLYKYIEGNLLEVKQDLLGLWHRNGFKIASIGLAVNKFVTYHGLALNYFTNFQMNNEIQKVYPCGLPGNIYKSVEDLSESKLSEESFNQFKTLFQSNFYEMIDKQISSFPTIDLISQTSNFENVSDNNLNTDLSLS